MTDLKPSSATVVLKVLKPNGNTVVKEIPWTVDKYNKDLDNLYTGLGFKMNLTVRDADEINSVVNSTYKQMGATDPFFVTAESQKKFSFVKIYPSTASKTVYGLKEDQNPKIYAALYKHNGKTIYSPDNLDILQKLPYKDYLNAYKAL